MDETDQVVKGIKRFLTENPAIKSQALGMAGETLADGVAVGNYVANAMDAYHWLHEKSKMRNRRYWCEAVLAALDDEPTHKLDYVE